MKTNNSAQQHFRTVKSFVLRKGRVTSDKSTLLTTLWPLYGIDQQIGTTIDFGKVFVRCAPTILEIGFGNGQTLLKMAEQYPELNFIGIEVYQSGIAQLLHNLKNSGITNLRVMRGDAVEILRNNIANHSLHTLQLFFPDPWPKARHHKRRIVQDDFVQLVASKLIKQGVFRVATDWENYAEHILEVMQHRTEFVQLPEIASVAEILARDTTKFEQRGCQLGHKINDLAYVLSKS